MTYCCLAQTADSRHLPPYLRNARKAYDASQRYIFQLDMGDKEFQQIAAIAERVKFMLEALEKEVLDGGS